MARLRSATKSAAASDNINHVTLGKSMPTPAKSAKRDSKKRKFVAESESSPEPLTSPQDLNFIESSSPPREDAPATPSTDCLYPSLDKFAVGAQTDDSSELYPSLDTAKTPRLSKIPTLAPTARKKARFANEHEVSADPKPSESTYATESGVPKLGEFEFKFSEGLEERGKKILEELKVSAAAIRAQMSVTPTGSDGVSASNNSKKIAPATTKRRRFSDAHKQEFDKMDSITTHYAAKRTPKNTVQTPEEPPNVLKRNKLEGKLDEREPPASPSPVKNRAVFDMQRTGNGITPVVKRVKLDETMALTEKPSKLARLTISGATTTPMKRPSTMRPPATVARMGMGKTLGTSAPIKKSIPVVPKPTASAESTPSGPSPSHQMQLDQVGVSKASKIPTTPARAKSISFNTPTQISTPNTVAVPKFSFAALRGSENGTITPKTSKVLRPPMTAGAFTFRAAPVSGLGFKRLSDMHDSVARRLESLPPPPISITATPKVTENDPVGMEDPFMGEGKRRATAAEIRNLAPETPVGATPMKFIKRKEMHPEEGADGGHLARKKLRFDESPKGDEMDIDKIEVPGTVKKQSLLATGKRLLTKGRLNMLATPRKIVSTLAGAKTDVKGKPRWR